MMILIATLLIDLAIFADSIGSPKRMPHQFHEVDGPPSTSGREFEDVAHSNAYSQGNSVLNVTCHYDKDGIFYEEDGYFYPVKLDIPLVECQGYILGRARKGLIHPIFNSKNQRVMTEGNDYNKQCLITKGKGRDTFKPYHLTPECRIVNVSVPHRHNTNVLPHEPEGRAESSASREKSVGKD